MFLQLLFTLKGSIMKSRYILTTVAILVAMVFALSGCAEEGGDDNNNVSEKVETTIDTVGGNITLSSGFTVTFPEGAVDQPLLVSVEETTLPSPLPGNITASSPVYKIDANNIKLVMPATITFPATGFDPSTQEGEVGIYRWDGTQWTFAGGGLKDNNISTSVNSFSVFITGTGRALHFPVEFDNFWTGEPGVVSVDRYVLAHPDLDAPIAATKAAAVFPPPFNWPTARMYLPQGSYSFCFEWNEEDIIEDKINRFYAFTGSLPSSPAAGLNENSSYVVPAYVSLNDSPKYVGRCPVPRAWTGDETSVDDAVESDFVGTFNALDPDRTSAAYRAIFTFNADGTFTGTEWADGVQGTFSGTWSFDFTTKIFSFAVPGGGAFSGQVVGSIINFIIGGTWNNGAPGQLQLYR